jgi:hypothetical protein
VVCDIANHCALTGTSRRRLPHICRVWFTGWLRGVRLFRKAGGVAYSRCAALCGHQHRLLSLAFPIIACWYDLARRCVLVWAPDNCGEYAPAPTWMSSWSDQQLRPSSLQALYAIRSHPGRAQERWAARLSAVPQVARYAARLLETTTSPLPRVSTSATAASASRGAPRPRTMGRSQAASTARRAAG